MEKNKSVGNKDGQKEIGAILEGVVRKGKVRSGSTGERVLQIFSERVFQAEGIAREKTLRWKISMAGVDRGRGER